MLLEEQEEKGMTILLWHETDINIKLMTMTIID